MDKALYAIEAEIEERHWWFVCRRELFARELKKIGIDANARILDIGTSTGTNLRMLRDKGYEKFHGLDLSEEAIAFCVEKGFSSVRQGSVTDIPFDDLSFDLVLATDIIEHVDDDKKALEEIRRVLSYGGKALISVPTFQSLWGLQDDMSFHKRRYRLAELKGKAAEAGLVCQKAYYFNFMLFPAIWAARKAIQVLKPKLESENQLNPEWANRLLKLVFSVDIALAPYCHIPFGVSALMIAEKQGNRDH